jgi:CheY-like chemotaxis protein/anti-sigma regulatory factor (Ser/Thr protein kinase)
VELAVEQMRPIIEDRRHELVTRFSAEPLAVLGDFQRLAEIATNLLSNAAKYTDMGGRIEISTEATPDEAILRVRDNGYGIPAGRTRELFAIFRQIPEHRHRSGNAGLGIGLALAKQLVELHGGVIEVNSEGENRGSEFVVRVPVHRASDLSTAAPVEPVPLPVRKVLIVEDNVDAATGLLLLLRLMGQKVEVAHDGATALQRVREFKPEVVLLDLGLPDISGLEVAERIRAMPDRESIKIVALTGWGRKEDRVRTQQVGFDDHLTKPIERAALEQTLREPTNR